MSVYYYLVCHKHKLGVGATSSGRMMAPEYELPAFIFEHSMCKCLEVLVEHEWYDLKADGSYSRYICFDEKLTPS